MEIRPIRTDADYESALKEIENLFDAEPGSPESDRLEVLITLVEAYEEQHFEIPKPDPIEAIEYHMERLGLTRRDLEKFIGSRARVSEILNRKRPLTLRMIRNLQAGLGISADILVQEYEVEYPEKNIFPIVEDIGEIIINDFLNSYRRMFASPKSGEIRKEQAEKEIFGFNPVNLLVSAADTKCITAETEGINQFLPVDLGCSEENALSVTDIRQEMALR